MKIVESAVCDLNPSPDRRVRSDQRDPELVQKVRHGRTTSAGCGRLEIKNLGMFFLEELYDPVHHCHKTFLVDVPGDPGSLAGLIVEFVKFVPSDRNDLRANCGLLDLVLEIPTQLGESEQCFSLQLGELERIRLVGLPGSLKAKYDRSRTVSRQKTFQTLHIY